ncbi:MAG: endonuclease/exonuclease/phosphatase family protein [Rhizobiaceae bacterium]|nr:endonuclease/exonuclease/phosphatase family protein [Rhizobiaceae bacterium]
MKFVSYNIQYSKGADGVFDLERIGDAVRGADIIGMQEVSRNQPGVPEKDQPQKLSQLLPEYFTCYGTAIDAGIESKIESGHASSTRLNFGNMILSKWPILSTRHFVLPWSGIVEQFDLQNIVLEALVDCPGGPLRVYVTHLNFRRSSVRAQQLEWLVPKLFAIENEGIGVRGDEWMGIPIPPSPRGFVVMGDFNLTPGCDEYSIIVGEDDFHYGRMVVADRWVDTWTRCGHDESNSVTWLDVDTKIGSRLDYGFVSPELAPKVKSAWIDHDCKASDHQPYWFNLDI